MKCVRTSISVFAVILAGCDQAPVTRSEFHSEIQDIKTDNQKLIDELKVKMSEVQTAALNPVGRFVLTKTAASSVTGTPLEVGILLDTSTGNAWEVESDVTLGGVIGFEQMPMFNWAKDGPAVWDKRRAIHAAREVKAKAPDKQ